MKLILKPNVIFEIGTGRAELCHSGKYFGQEGCSVYLFDPIKLFTDEILKIKQDFNYNNIYVFNAAIHDYNGTVDIYDHLEASSIVGINNPSIQTNKDNYFNEESYKGILTVNCFKISEFDKGNIDVLLVDTEGSEWFVLKHLISRPYLISIELKMKNYINPYISNIYEWMLKNEYTLLFDNQNNSDSFFIRNDIVELSKRRPLIIE